MGFKVDSKDTLREPRDTKKEAKNSQGPRTRGQEPPKRQPGDAKSDAKGAQMGHKKTTKRVPKGVPERRTPGHALKVLNPQK